VQEVPTQVVCSKTLKEQKLDTYKQRPLSTASSIQSSTLLASHHPPASCSCPPTRSWPALAPALHLAPANSLSLSVWFWPAVWLLPTIPPFVRYPPPVQHLAPAWHLAPTRHMAPACRLLLPAINFLPTVYPAGGEVLLCMPDVLEVAQVMRRVLKGPVREGCASSGR
jgi:hypothetical protein